MPSKSRDTLDTGEKEAINDAVKEAMSGGGGVSPDTRVSMTVKTFIAMVSAIVVILLGGTGGYYALASTDARLEAKSAQADAKTLQLEKRVDGFATKEDLKTLRLQMRMDLLSSVWQCSKDEEGGMQCRPRPPRGGYEELR